MPSIFSLLGPGAFFLINLFLFCLGFFMLFIGVDPLELTGEKDIEFKGVSVKDLTTGLRHDQTPGSKIIHTIGMFIGGWLVLTGFFGMTAALLGLRCLYMVFINIIVISLLLWVAFIFGATYLASKQKDIHDIAVYTFEFGLRFEYKGDPDKPTTFEKTVNSMQVELGCCGMDSYTEYRQFAILWIVHTNNSLVVPPSCCLLDKAAFLKSGAYILKDNNCTRSPTPANSHMNKPCYPLLETNFHPKTEKFRFLAVGVPIFMLVLLGLSVYLMICGDGIFC